MITVRLLTDLSCVILLIPVQYLNLKNAGLIVQRAHSTGSFLTLNPKKYSRSSLDSLVPDSYMSYVPIRKSA